MPSIKIALSLIAAFSLPVLSRTINGLSSGSSTNTSTSLTVLALLLLCFSYLHYMLHNYLHPYESASKERKSQIIQAANNYYSKSFFHGAIGLGYVVILMSAMPLFVQNMNIDSFSYLVIAMLFVIFGTASKARGLVLYLLDEQKENTHKKVLKPDAEKAPRTLA